MLATARQRLPHARGHAVGVSLGGNAMLKHLGEQGDNISWLASSAAVSVPMDLLACGTQLSDTTIGQRLYTRYFLKTMKAKISEKAKRFPGNIDVFRLSQCKTDRKSTRLNYSHKCETRMPTSAG